MVQGIKALCNAFVNFVPQAQRPFTNEIPAKARNLAPLKVLENS